MLGFGTAKGAAKETAKDAKKKNRQAAKTPRDLGCF